MWCTALSDFSESARCLRNTLPSVLKAKLPPLQTPAAAAAQDKDRQSITSQEEHEQDFLRKLSMLSTAAGLPFGVDGLRNRKPWPIRVNHFGHMSLFKKRLPQVPLVYHDLSSFSQ